MTAGTPEPVISSRPWPAETTDELDAWRQGHNFEGVVPIAVGGTSVTESFWTPASVVAEIGSSLVIAGVPVEARRVMVISQGCDIIKPTFPCVTVVPVYDAALILPENQLGNIRAGRVWHMVHLTASWTSDGAWVADLRLEFSVDKSVLIDATPVDSFNDETDYVRLAERLAAVRSRPAVPEACLQHVVQPLQLELTRRSESGLDPLAGVREMRVQSDHHSLPSSVTLFVVATDVIEELDREQWFETVDVVREHANSHNLTLNGPEFVTLWDISAADYLTSQAVAEADSS